MLTGIIRFVISGIGYIILKDYESQKRNLLEIVALGALSAIFGGMSYILQLNGAKELPATVLYPFITGGTIIFTSIAGFIVFVKNVRKTFYEYRKMFFRYINVFINTSEVQQHG